jgi:signal transduction histidine kinase
MSPQQQQEQLEKILSQTDYLEKMMDNMLTARDALMGHLTVDLQPMSIDAVCKPIFEQVKIARGTPSHVFNYENRARTPVSMLDETLLTYVFENLLSNAVKYSPEGGTVSMQIDEKDDFYIITVQDEGIGIPEASKGDVFDMFQRGENVKSLPGTGIGLGLAYNAIRAHGGDISFSSVEDEGSTFYVRLPVVLPDSFLPSSGAQPDDDDEGTTKDSSGHS